MFLKKSVLKDTYAPKDIDARPFKDNQAEQFNLLNKDYLRKLPLENLTGTSDWFNNLLKENIYFTDERREKLCTLLKDRIESGIYLVQTDKRIPITKNKHKRDLEKIQGLSLIILPDYLTTPVLQPLPVDLRSLCFFLRRDFLLILQ